ncbi:MAG: hypothetical protein QM757_24495 [Paludibaculum sp.]
MVTQDVLPYSLTVTPRESKVFGANKIGLERRGFPVNRSPASTRCSACSTRAKLNTSQAVGADPRGGSADCAEVDELIGFIERPNAVS